MIKFITTDTKWGEVDSLHEKGDYRVSTQTNSTFSIINNNINKVIISNIPIADTTINGDALNQDVKLAVEELLRMTWVVGSQSSTPVTPTDPTNPTNPTAPQEQYTDTQAVEAVRAEIGDSEEILSTPTASVQREISEKDDDAYGNLYNINIPFPNGVTLPTEAKFYHAPQSETSFVINYLSSLPSSGGFPPFLHGISIICGGDTIASTENLQEELDGIKARVLLLNDDITSRPSGACVVRFVVRSSRRISATISIRVNRIEVIRSGSLHNDLSNVAKPERQELQDRVNKLEERENHVEEKELTPDEALVVQTLTDFTQETHTQRVPVDKFRIATNSALSEGVSTDNPYSALANGSIYIGIQSDFSQAHNNTFIIKVKSSGGTITTHTLSGVNGLIDDFFVYTAFSVKTGDTITLQSNETSREVTVLHNVNQNKIEAGRNTKEINDINTLINPARPLFPRISVTQEGVTSTDRTDLYNSFYNSWRVTRGILNTGIGFISSSTLRVFTGVINSDTEETVNILSGGATPLVTWDGANGNMYINEYIPAQTGTRTESHNIFRQNSAEIQETYTLPVGTSISVLYEVGLPTTPTNVSISLGLTLNGNPSGTATGTIPNVGGTSEQTVSVIIGNTTIVFIYEPNIGIRVHFPPDSYGLAEERVSVILSWTETINVNKPASTVRHLLGNVSTGEGFMLLADARNGTINIGGDLPRNNENTLVDTNYTALILGTSFYSYVTNFGGGAFLNNRHIITISELVNNSFFRDGLDGIFPYVMDRYLGLFVATESEEVTADIDAIVTARDNDGNKITLGGGSGGGSTDVLVPYSGISTITSVTSTTGITVSATEIADKTEVHINIYRSTAGRNSSHIISFLQIMYFGSGEEVNRTRVYVSNGPQYVELSFDTDNNLVIRYGVGNIGTEYSNADGDTTTDVVVGWLAFK